VSWKKLVTSLLFFYRFGLFLMILMVLFPVRAQIPFRVTNYERSVYSAGNQNWAIDLDNAGNLYVGNTKGLLILKGTSFSLFEMPLKTPVRSVRFIDGLIYSGSFEDFCYWQKDEAGNLKYHSLVPQGFFARWRYRKDFLKVGKQS